MNQVQHLTSETSGHVPDNGLNRGEIAVNIADKKLWVYNDSGDAVQIYPKIVTGVDYPVVLPAPAAAPGRLWFNGERLRIYAGGRWVTLAEVIP